MAESPAAPAWTITNQMETSDLGPSGSYVSGVKVSFRTASGATGSVFVAQADYTTERVRAAVAAKAAVADEIAGLTG
jgi:hypothetical protein